MIVWGGKTSLFGCQGVGFLACLRILIWHPLSNTWLGEMVEVQLFQSQWLKPSHAKKALSDTVDGRNPANQLRLVVYPIMYRVFIHPRLWSPDFRTINRSVCFFSPSHLISAWCIYDSPRCFFTSRCFTVTSFKVLYIYILSGNVSGNGIFCVSMFSIHFYLR